MRFKLYFTIEKEYLDIDYRRSILSFIKKSLCEYDESYFKELYHDKDPIMKPYTFAVFFNGSEFQKDRIVIKQRRFNLIFSTSDDKYALVFYNSFYNQVHKIFHLNRNSMVLYNIDILPEREIESNEINIKLLSPLVVKSRHDNKDTYYSIEKEEFKEVLKQNIKEQLKITNIDEGNVNLFEIEPISAKKVIIKNYGINLECSIGKFKIIAPLELLNYLYKAGIGSKRSLGFGCFQIIK